MIRELIIAILSCEILKSITRTFSRHDYKIQLDLSVLFLGGLEQGGRLWTPQEFAAKWRQGAQHLSVRAAAQSHPYGNLYRTRDRANFSRLERYGLPSAHCSQKARRGGSGGVWLGLATQEGRSFKPSSSPQSGAGRARGDAAATARATPRKA